MCPFWREIERISCEKPSERWQAILAQPARPYAGSRAPAAAADPRCRTRTRRSTGAECLAFRCRRGTSPAKLARGVPALTGEPIPLPVPVLKPTLVRLCEALGEGGAGDAATHIRDAIDGGNIEPGSLLAASLTRNQAAIRTGATHRGLAPDLVWLVAELAVSPFVHALQRMLFANRRRKPAVCAARLEPRLLSRLRIVAGAGRSRWRAPHAALLVLLQRVGAADLRLHLLRRERRGVRHRRAGRGAQRSPRRGVHDVRRAT